MRAILVAAQCIGLVVNALASINVVNRLWARLVLGWVTVCGLRAGKPSRYATSHLGQLSFPSLRGRSLEYLAVWLGLRRGVFTCVGWEVKVTLCENGVISWQVTLRSCVMGYVLLTAIQYLYPLNTAWNENFLYRRKRGIFIFFFLGPVIQLETGRQNG